VTPQETDPDLPVSVQESPGRRWPAAGLEALSAAVRAWDLLKEVAIFFIPFSSGPRFVRILHHDQSILGGPTWHGS